MDFIRIAPFAVVAYVLAALFSLFLDTRSNKQRLIRLEHKIDILLKYHGLEGTSAQIPDRVRRYLAEGRKVEAIKVWREIEPDLPLDEAKAHVETFLRAGVEQMES